jgi:hypothetical protein
MEFYTDENILIPLMRCYRDFNFCNYVLNLNYDIALSMYLGCIDEYNDKKFEDRCWSMYLIEIQNGLEKSFEDYFKNKKFNTEVLTKDEKDIEEKRIIEKFRKVGAR